MEIVTLSVGELQANCYLLYGKNSRETIIVDPGDEATFITDEILRLKLTPTAIITTHGHFDHLMASWELQKNFNIPFYLHPKDNFLLNRMQSSAKHWLEREIIEQTPQPQDIGLFISASSARRPLAGTTRRRLAGEIAVIETPGHTPGSLCLALPEEKIIFTGDTMFADGIGSTEHSYSSKFDLFKSINTIMQKYTDWTAYPGHGECFFI